MNDEYLDEYRELTKERVELLRSVFGGSPDLLDSTSIRRELHTLRGEAQLMGFAAMTELGRGLEALYVASGREHAELIVEGLNLCEVLCQRGGEQPAPPEVAAYLDRCRSATGEISSLPRR